MKNMLALSICDLSKKLLGFILLDLCMLICSVSFPFHTELCKLHVRTAPQCLLLHSWGFKFHGGTGRPLSTIDLRSVLVNFAVRMPFHIYLDGFYDWNNFSFYFFNKIIKKLKKSCKLSVYDFYKTCKNEKGKRKQKWKVILESFLKSWSEGL